MKLFGTDGIRGTYGQEPFTPETIKKIAQAIAIDFKRTDKKTVFYIARDTRSSGREIEEICARIFSKNGIETHLLGVLPTPALGLATKEKGVDLGMMITASHNPASDNGIKLFNSDGYKISDNQQVSLEKQVASLEHVVDQVDTIGGIISEQTIGAETYIKAAKKVQEDSLQNSKITAVIDCAHGATSDIAPKIFKQFGVSADVINASPNGHNINDQSGAMHPEKAAEKVKALSASIGISFDGDGDRAIFIDEKGNIIDGDRIIFLVAVYLHQNQRLRHNKIVVTNYSNLALDAALKENGIDVVRVKNGDRFVVEEMRKNNISFGGEKTGHIIHDHTTTGDGIMTALQVIQIMHQEKKHLSELASLSLNPQIITSVDVQEKIPFDKIPDLDKKIKKLSVEMGDEGRILMRYSGTEMKARIMVEGQNKEKIEQYSKELAKSLK